VPGVPRTVSVVTAVHGPSARFLPAAYGSLVDQAMPAGWAWEWLVQEDGTTGCASALVPDDDRISFGTGRPLGPGVARTYALARAHGEFVKVLDADDLLTPGTLAREIAVLTAHDEVGWTTCRALDLLPDGTTVEHTNTLFRERSERGRTFAHWLHHGHRLPVHPATLCIRRSLLLSLGGWMALPAGEDTGLLLAADAVAPGYHIDELGLFYRKWPGQATATQEHTNPTERLHRNAVIEARARVLAATFAPA
jgi:glycosyltransferase involved in cell wall biosynthesis